MSDGGPPPLLPDGTDPYEILGVKQGADELDLKRAYTRKIRVYRPDRSPLEFQRVRAAYEEALDRIHHRALFDSLDQLHAPVSEPTPVEDEGDEAPVGPPREAPDPAAPWAGAAIWAHEAEGRQAQAEALLDRLLAERGNDAALHATRFLLSESRGEDERAYGDLAAAIDRSPELALWASEVFSPPERDRLAGENGVTLEHLLRQRDPGAADELQRRRLDVLIRRGDGSVLLAEAMEDAVRRGAREDEYVAALLLRIASATAWSHPDEADALFQHAASGAPEGTPWELAYETRVRTRPAYERWKNAYPAMHGLARFLEICDALGPNALEKEQRRLAAAARARPVEHAEALSSFAGSDPELYMLLLEGLGAAYEEEDQEPAPPGGEAKGMIQAALRATDKALAKDFANSLSMWIGGLTLVGTIYLFATKGVWGWAGVGCFLAWVLFLLVTTDNRLYRRIVRPQIAKLVARTSCTPADVLRELKNITKFTDDVGRFDAEIEEDEGLEILSQMLRATQ